MMKSMQLIVWGIILIVIGLGLACWGGWRSYNDISSWQSARSQMQQLESLTPPKIAELQKEATSSGNFAEGFFGMMLSSPMFLNIAKAKAADEMSAANQELYSSFPMALFGLFLLYSGNRMLGRAKKSD